MKAFLKIARRFCLVVATIGLATAAGFGQNGKLIEQVPLLLEGKEREALSSPSALQYLDDIRISQITYSSDGLKVKGFLVVPKAEGKYPCVIFNRGGNREFGAISPRMAAMMLGRIASWGYVVAASQYRGNGGGEGREEFGGADVNDVLNLIPLLEALPQADSSRIGMYGWSRGGMMTYLALKKTDRIKAAVIGAALVDLPGSIKTRPEMETEVYAQLIPDYAKNKVAALQARSALRWPEKICATTPLLLLQGSADWRVSPTDSFRMATALYERRRPIRLVLLEGGDHGLTEHRLEVNRLAKDWLDRYVRDGKPWPSLEPHGN